jgi:hypothetical protein
MKQDKHEIFRAARDAHRAADFLLALEHYKSVDQALAHVNGTPSPAAIGLAGTGAQPIQSVAQSADGIEMER